jgi:hypothetical protein
VRDFLFFFFFFLLPLLSLPPLAMKIQRIYTGDDSELTEDAFLRFINIGWLKKKAMDG